MPVAPIAAPSAARTAPEPAAPLPLRSFSIDTIKPKPFNSYMHERAHVWNWDGKLESAADRSLWVPAGDDGKGRPRHDSVYRKEGPTYRNEHWPGGGVTFTPEATAAFASFEQAINASGLEKLIPSSPPFDHRTATMRIEVRRKDGPSDSRSTTYTAPLNAIPAPMQAALDGHEALRDTLEKVQQPAR